MTAARHLRPLLLGAVLLSACTIASESSPRVEQKLYVAVEGENRIAVLDPQTQSVITTIDLSDSVDGVIHEFTPHNVQVAPDGKSVWVTANHGHDAGHGGDEGHEADPRHGELAPDQVIVIDPQTDRIIERIPIDVGSHLAHIVVSQEGLDAYVTAQMQDLIYQIDVREFEVVKRIRTPKGSQPHGLRISPDGATAYVALLEGQGLGILDLRADTLTSVPLAGSAVQTAVTPDGKLAIVSLYDTSQLAVFDVQAQQVSYVDLPQSAKGPIQLYATGDSHFVYVADQGYYGSSEKI